MSIDNVDSIAERDRRGYTVLDALTHAGLGLSPTYSKPDAFICVDGHTYWVKAEVQQGLVAELIAGRLAERIGAGPVARIIRVSSESRPPDGSADHLDGTIVGSRHADGVVNARELSPLMASGQFQAGAIDPATRARVVAFQTWIGVGDSQVLISLTDGKVLSIDHGECFGNVDDLVSPPALVLTDIPGIAPDVGRDSVHVIAAVERIEAITEAHLVEAVSQIPAGSNWSAPSDRRLSIAKWLLARRDSLRPVLEGWMT